MKKRAFLVGLASLAALPFAGAAVAAPPDPSPLLSREFLERYADRFVRLLASMTPEQRKELHYTNIRLLEIADRTGVSLYITSKTYVDYCADHPESGLEEALRRTEAALVAYKQAVLRVELSPIPEPDCPLNAIGRAKYDELVTKLYEQNRLTKVGVTQASALALLHQKIHARAAVRAHDKVRDEVASYCGEFDVTIIPCR